MGILIKKTGTSETSSILVEKEDENKGKPTRHFSKIQETAVAEATGGSRTLNSGATMFQKGDTVTDQWLFECKTKTSHADSMSVKKEWIEKNRKEALFMGKKYSAVVFNFGPGEENHYIIDEWLFLELLEYLKNKPEED